MSNNSPPRFTAPDPSIERHQLTELRPMLSEHDHWELTKLCERYGIASVLHDVARLAAYEEDAQTWSQSLI